MLIADSFIEVKPKFSLVILKLLRSLFFKNELNSFLDE